MLPDVFAIPLHALDVIVPFPPGIVCGFDWLTLDVGDSSDIIFSLVFIFSLANAGTPKHDIVDIAIKDDKIIFFKKIPP